MITLITLITLQVQEVGMAYAYIQKLAAEQKQKDSDGVECPHCAGKGKLNDEEQKRENRRKKAASKNKDELKIQVNELLQGNEDLTVIKPF